MDLTEKLIERAWARLIRLRIWTSVRAVLKTVMITQNVGKLLTVDEPYDYKRQSRLHPEMPKHVAVP
jgi:hypothetical protein